MAKRGKIERAGREADVLAWAAKGLGSRAISKLLAEQGLKVSHTSVNRFLSEETDDRERARRATTAKKAAEIAGAASEAADLNLAELSSYVPALGTMVRDGYHTVAIPGEDPVHLPCEAKDRIAAARAGKDLLAYLVELAGANPRATDPKSVAAIREAIGSVFGYGELATPTPPAIVAQQEAPPTAEEHQPPVMH